MAMSSELASEGTPDPDVQQQEELLKNLLVTIQHFFGGFPQLFRPVTEPRNPLYITYPLAALGSAGVLLFLFRLGARRQLNAWLRGNGPAAAKFQALFNVETCPHGDTLNAAFKRLDPQQLQEVVSGMLKTLIRKKVLYQYRLLGRYFVIAIDGTGRLTFPVRHCPHCLTATHHGKTIYYHPVLEAKAVFPNGFAFSIMTEFVENPAAHPTKQDCELKAFYRLAQRLKQAFPRLPLCLSMNALFAGGPCLTICEQYGWKYLIALQEGSIPYINEEFQALLPLEPENHLLFHTGPQHQIRQDYRWINDIAYVDSVGDEHTVAVLECLENKPATDGSRKTTRFKWITNFTVKRKQVIALAHEGGRIRWKIENEGFNVQKNGGYGLEHAYTRDATASKIFYYLLQIAHILAQLIERGSLFRKAFPAGVGSAKNIAGRLLEAWRNCRLTHTQLHHMLTLRVQIRFQPP